MGFYFLPVAFMCGLGLGFLLGLWSYAHVHAHFYAKAEESTNRKVLRAMQEQKKKEVDAKLVAEKLRAMYGDDLSQRHVEVLNEEVEQILSQGPKR